MTKLSAHTGSHRFANLARLALSSSALLVCVLGSTAGAQQSFKSAEDAATALVNAAKTANRAAILTVLGQGAADIVSSGDEVADKEVRERFVATYDEKHGIAMEGKNQAFMIIGKEDFPFPIPIVRKGDTWQFDTAAGRKEILFRRIGRNELDTIRASLAFVDAQDEYAEKDHGAGIGAYAQRVVSEPGKQDGLYWPTSGGEEQSPLGDLMASATSEGYKAGGGHQPYHGYYYKILTKQGPHAPGGALDYVVNGKMIGGFALVAYPAEYGNSGIMTFIVNHAGIVLQKDLGQRTEQIATQMTSFDPDRTWVTVDTRDVD